MRYTKQGSKKLNHGQKKVNSGAKKANAQIRKKRVKTGGSEVGRHITQKNFFDASTSILERVQKD